MGSYLTNDKMDPDLQARIEASVKGGRPAAGRDRAPQPLRTGLRLVSAVAIVSCIGLLAHTWRDGRNRLDAARSRIIAEHSAAAAPLETLPRRVASITNALMAAAGVYAGDLVHASLRETNGLDFLLEEPLLYVRGPIQVLRSRGRLPAAIADSRKDSFLSCLAAPPPSRLERDLLPTVASTYRGVLPASTGQTHRAQALFSAVPLLTGGWSDKAAAAVSVAELQALREELELGQLPRAARAMAADRMLFVLDEPPQPGAISELDGASDHRVRIGIVDLDTGDTLLRVRKRIDPSWISEGRRATHARGLNGCRLGIDLRAALGPAPAVERRPLVRAMR